MRHASVNARSSRRAVTGLAATVLTLMALAAGPSAPAAPANLDAAPAVSQQETAFTYVQTDVTTPSDPLAGTAADDGLSAPEDDLTATTEAEAFAASDFSFEPRADTNPPQDTGELGDGSEFDEGGLLALVGDERSQKQYQQHQQSMSPKPPPTAPKPTRTLDCNQIVSVAELFQRPKAPQKDNILRIELNLGLPGKLHDSLAGKINALTGNKNVVKTVVGYKVQHVEQVGANYLIQVHANLARHQIQDRDRRRARARRARARAARRSAPRLRADARGRTRSKLDAVAGDMPRPAAAPM